MVKKPCPFCGGVASTGSKHVGNAIIWFVNCVDCLASTNVLIDDAAAETMEEAVEAWNRRAVP